MTTPNELKASATAAVAQFEGYGHELRLERATAVRELLDALPHWTDTSAGVGFTSVQWDTKQNLYRRLTAAHRAAIVALGRTGSGIAVTRQREGDVAQAAAEGFGEGLREGAATLRSFFGDVARRVRALGPAVPAILVGAIALGVFFRVRG